MSDLSPNVNFENAAKSYELETQRIEVLAQARLADMKTASVAEHIVNQRLTNIVKAVSVAEFESSLHRYRLKRDAIDRNVRRFREAATNLSYYRDGHLIADAVRQNCWAGYRVLSRLIPFSVISEWSKTLLAFEPWDDGHWVGRMISGRIVSIELPTQAEAVSVRQLIDYQLEHHRVLVVRSGSLPHVATMDAFQTLSDEWASQSMKLAKEIADIQSGVYDIWKPGDLLKLSDNPV